MKNLFKKISVPIIAALLLLTGGYIGYNPESVFGAFQPVGGTTYRLQSSVGLANTTLTLSSFKSRSGIPWTMSMLGTDIVYATIDPQTSSSEFVSFTGITQNPNGTATITGLTRGLSDFYPFTASSTMQRPHAGQAVFIISDAPQLFNEYGAKRNAENISGIWNFQALPTTTETCSSPFQFCNKSYIDAGLNQGGATSTETNIGFVELATNTEIAAGTASSSAGGPLVPPNKYFTPTPSLCNTIACVPVAVSGRISSQFIATTSSDSYKFATGTVTVGSSASGGLTPAGSVIAYASTTPPAGWLLADGSSVLRTAYPDLYSVIGTSYGAADATHFTLPNLLGRNILMASSTANIGQTGGEDRHTLTTAEIPSHAHDVPALDSFATNGGSSNRTSITGTQSSGSTGGGGSHNVLDPYLVLNYMIKY